MHLFAQHARNCRVFAQRTRNGRVSAQRARIEIILAQSGRAPTGVRTSPARVYEKSPNPHRDSGSQHQLAESWGSARLAPRFRPRALRTGALATEGPPAPPLDARAPTRVRIPSARIRKEPESASGFGLAASTGGELGIRTPDTRCGGELGIRTPDTRCGVYSLSRRAPSASRSALRNSADYDSAASPACARGLFQHLKSARRRINTA